MWLRPLFPLPKRKSERPRGRVPGRLQLEPLEALCLPSFLSPVNYPVGAYPVSALSADFNGDNIPDVAVANNSGDSVSVLLGHSDGTFQAATTPGTGDYPLGSYPHSLAVGDVNGDHKLDVVTANAYGLSVLLGNGDGSFQPPTTIDPGSYPASVAVGDVNGDGKMDLAVTGNVSVFDGYYYGYYGGRYPHYHNEGVAHVLLGNGGGTFGAPLTTSLGVGYFSGAATGDFNHDGRDDLATAQDSGAVDVLLADPAGSGHLQTPSGYTTGWGSRSVAVGDVNGDGIGDLVVMNAYSVSALLGNGDSGLGNGTFRGAVTTGLDSYYPTSVATGDFNADGKLDLALSSNRFVVDYYGYYGPYGHYEGEAKVLLGYANGHFTVAQTADIGAGYAAGLASGDYDGDGFSDLAVPNPYMASLSVLINDQSWPPLPPPSLSVNDVTVAEGNAGTTNATFTISLEFAHTGAITVHYATADITATAGSDYTATSGDVTFAPGETAKTISVPVLGDRVGEGNETFALTITSADAPVADGQGIGTIEDDEPRVSIGGTTVAEGNTGSTNATFTVTLSTAYDRDVTVHYATANGSATAGSDYTGVSDGTVTIPAGKTSQTFTVAVLGDRVAEPDESFVVNLSGATNALISDGQGVGTILDDEPRITISDVTMLEGSGTGKNNSPTRFVFTVTLSAAYDQAVTVGFATADGSARVADDDYTAASGTITFAPGETTKTITVLVTADKKKESNEWFAVNLTGSSTNALLLDNQGVGWILDDDSRGKR